MFQIDGQTFNVGVVSLKREAPFLDRYAERTENGELQRDLIGVYYNYSLTFPEITGADNLAEYARLYNKLTEPTEYHEITVPDCVGTITYTAYITGVNDELIRISNVGNQWGKLTVKFIAKSPIRS